MIWMNEQQLMYTDDQLRTIYMENVFKRFDEIRAKNPELGRYLGGGLELGTLKFYPQANGACASGGLSSGSDTKLTLGVLVGRECIFNPGEFREMIRAIEGVFHARTNRSAYSILTPGVGAAIVEPNTDIHLFLPNGPAMYMCEYIPERKLVSFI